MKTRDGVALGTPEYMAPGSAPEPARSTARPCLFARRVVLYRNRRGRTTVPSSEGSRLRSLHLYTPPPPLGTKCQNSRN